MSNLPGERLAWALTLAMATLAGCGPERGVVLVYELNPPQAGASRSPLYTTANVMSRRLKQDDAGRVSASVETSQLTVFLTGPPAPAEVAALKWRLETVGALELRIMASEKFAPHQPIIAAAGKLAENESTLIQGGVAVARWAPLDAREFPTQQDPQHRGLVSRTAGGTLQALVLLNDGLDVTGQSFKDVRGDVPDEMGAPQIQFTLDAQGATLLGQLTGSHLPTPTGDRYSLGILLDGTVLSAPTIESRISARGRISGSLTKEEAAALAAILNSGPLPRAVKLVSEREFK